MSGRRKAPRAQTRRADRALGRTVVAAAGLVALGVVWWAAPGGDGSPAARTAPPVVMSPSPGPSPSPSGRGVVPEYDRSAFRHWVDADGDGCDTRAEVLQRFMRAEKVRDANGGGCLVLSGRLTDPYTRVTAVVDASDVDIDHVVALADAWRSGASGWTAQEREVFANDPANLLPTEGAVNKAKSDKGPDEWSPSSRLGACTYLRTYKAVKATYDLKLTNAQAAAVAVGLKGCPA